MGLIDSKPDTYLPRDGSLNNLKTIDVAHAQIHAGLHWTATHAVSVGTATAVTVLITAPATGTYHVSFAIGASNSGTFTFSEAPNASGGTAITGYNNDRSSSTATTLVHTHTVTYVSSGTILQNGVIGTSGIGNATAGGAGESRTEWELAASTLYLVRFVALNAGTSVAVNVAYYRES